LTLPVLAVGGTGVISVAGHIVGKKMKEMITAFFLGDLAKAQAIHLELHPFFRAIFITTNPIPIKTAVNVIGLNAGPLRLPMVAATENELEHIKQAMRDVGALN
jgi:4-hydroxy-tetrahydrodipicolinate synthase